MELWRDEVTSGALEVAHWALEELGLAPQGPQFAPLLQAFEEASHSGRVRMIDGALTTLTRLDEAGVGCALICDTIILTVSPSPSRTATLSGVMPSASV